MYWNEYGTKSQSKQTTNEYRYFLGSTFVGVNRLFELIYLNRNNDVNNLKLQGIIYQKALSQVITSLSMGEKFMTNPLLVT